MEARAKGANGPWELYDIDAGYTELNNLASLSQSVLPTWLSAGRRGRESPRQALTLGAVREGIPRVFQEAKFTLKQGDHLPQTQAPMVRGKEFTVEARVAAGGKDGVIVAQGGTNHGWSLHIWKGTLRFVTRHGIDGGCRRKTVS